MPCDTNIMKSTKVLNPRLITPKTMHEHMIMQHATVDTIKSFCCMVTTKIKAFQGLVFDVLHYYSLHKNTNPWQPYVAVQLFDIMHCTLLDSALALEISFCQNFI